MNKKFIIWQLVILTLLGIGIWRGNYYLMGIFGGLELIILYAKFRKKEDYQYCFPAKMAWVMKKVPQQTQYEGSMLGMFLIMLGLIAMLININFFGTMDLTTRIFFSFNLVAGLILLFFSLTTTYQQYVTFKETMEVIKEIPDNVELNKKKEAKND